ncbi:FAD-dependent monooxygenase [Streptomyces sp. NPDC053493]|uniref:FAD-dependent monooxygenase n=1 Tax=Streptomyces sp. NPDC053493 TaxID=3365705 RepID=UPI0037D20593
MRSDTDTARGGSSSPASSYPASSRPASSPAAASWPASAWPAGSSVDVLVVGAGPVGLTAAAELRRQGTAVRIVERLPARLPYAKAVGIQPRTLEIWDRMGCVREVLEAAVPLRGQIVYMDGVEQLRFELRLPDEVPYRFAALPQYETERILEEFLGRFGTYVERGTELAGFAQDEDGVTARLVRHAGADGPPAAEEEVRCRYLVGCDGAHSTVRKGLGLSFEGGAFPEEFMLGDVEVDWDLPPEYGIRSMHHGPDGAVDDALVCVPLPGRGRYRMSMHVPPGLSLARRTGAEGAEGAEGVVGGGSEAVAHGLEQGRGPGLADIQAVLDRLAPRPATASALRWSSVFRISHRLVDRYGVGRVFVAGDAAHIHPPTGAQGMNTGVQDAYNLAWKLSLAVRGAADPRLLASYDVERRPVGEEVVRRTVRHAAEGVQADPEDPATLMLREAQLLVGYRGSPIVTDDGGGDGAGPRPGDRAPDCTGLTDPLTSFPLRLYDVLRGRGHVLLLYADPAQAGAFAELVAHAAELAGDAVEACAVLPSDGAAGAAGGAAGAAGGAADRVVAGGATAPFPAFPHPLAVYRDARGEFARQYAVTAPTAFLVRPDGYLGARLGPPGTANLAAYLTGVFGA